MVWTTNCSQVPHRRAKLLYGIVAEAFQVTALSLRRKMKERRKAALATYASLYVTLTTSSSKQVSITECYAYGVWRLMAQ